MGQIVTNAHKPVGFAAAANDRTAGMKGGGTAAAVHAAIGQAMNRLATVNVQTLRWQFISTGVPPRHRTFQDLAR